MTQKIVINCEHGGFGISDVAEVRYAELAGKPHPIYSWEIQRDDPHLVQVVEELGSRADGACADLKIVEVPDDVEWTIHEYNGCEWVAEAHRTWS